MADISNRTLAIMMVVAILVSLGGLFISLDRLSKLQAGVPPSITGFGTSGTGKANVSIGTTTSISLPNSVIQFGTCSITGGQDLLLESNWTCVGQATCNSMNVSGGTCLNGTDGDGAYTPDNITIQNDGNVYINVTLGSSHTSETLFDSVDAARNDYFGYRTINYSGAAANAACGVGWAYDALIGGPLSVNYSGGSTGDSGWTNITSTSTNYTVCFNLSKPVGSIITPRVQFQARMIVPRGESPGQKQATLIFTAKEAGT